MNEEKQEMVVICKPEESKEWFEKLWQNTVDLFRSLDIPVRTLECCSGDLADLKVKSIDVEAWSPRQKKYFEVGSCSNLGDAQARRLKIRVKNEDGDKYFAHTLNNTVVAPPRMLIAFLENNLQEKFLCIYLNSNNNIITSKVLFIGTVDCSNIYPRDIFREAVRNNASGIIMVHNHPSGNTSPSLADIDLTNKIINLGKQLGIKVLDHVIIGDNNYYSFLENNKELFGVKPVEKV